MWPLGHNNSQITQSPQPINPLEVKTLDPKIKPQGLQKTRKSGSYDANVSSDPGSLSGNAAELRRSRSAENPTRRANGSQGLELI